MTTTTDTTTDTATVEPQPAVAEETTPVDTEGAETSDVSPNDGAEVDEDQDDATDDDGHSDGPGREAAKYRRRLREAEAERDRLAEHIESLQRAEVDRLATADDLRPAALWASGVALADVLNDDGTVDAAKVSAAIGRRASSWGSRTRRRGATTSRARVAALDVRPGRPGGTR